MASSKLRSYRAKRDFTETPEPGAAKKGRTGRASKAAPARRRPRAKKPRFVIQEHSATRLHWDLRLEHDGVLASWAVPNGIPDDPGANRKAIRTEDHPLEYLDFEGEIPRGQYGAGTMAVWDRGTYECEKWEPDKVVLTFDGDRVSGRYALFRAGREPKDWMIHRMDPPVDPDREPLPEKLRPMLARPGPLPPDDGRWAFEIKWDGIRALVFSGPGRLRLRSRTGRDITGQYPEVRRLNRALGSRTAVLDGEIVAFDDRGHPSFERLQERMHVASESAVRRRARELPAVFMAFDLPFLDGHSLMELPYAQRRRELEGLALDGTAWKTPESHDGDGAALLEASAAQGLEGLVAKRLDSPYEAGRRSACWIKVKNTRRQELVIGGWLPGEGRRRARIGALLVGYHDDGELRFAGRVGTGFTDATLADLGRRLGQLERDTSPFRGRGVPRGAVFCEPELVAEIEFSEWTRAGILRAASYKGLRFDKDPAEVVREDRLAVAAEGSAADEPPTRPPGRARRRPSRGPAEVFDELRELPGGAVEVDVQGRPLKISNRDKVLYPATGFTKGDLIEYYARIAPALLPHLRDRPLTLKRYPDGVEGQHFYEKQCPRHRPDWVTTAAVSSGRRGKIDYCLAQDLATLVWLGNLADLELHTSLSLAEAIERPTMLVFDLDPGEPATIVQCCEVGLVLRGLFEELGRRCLAKTSGSKGLQVYVPLNAEGVTYAQTKPFARRVAELLEQQMPDRAVSRMTRSARHGRVLVDWSQNDEHKTTVCAYSVRARERPTVSTPVTWDEVQRARAQGDPELLVFDTEDVLARVARDGDLFADVVELRQELPEL
jgi:bifunctional non-homologous end joining protein LigD